MNSVFLDNAEPFPLYHILKQGKTNILLIIFFISEQMYAIILNNN